MKTQLLNSEIAALRRIQNFEGIYHDVYAPGMFEFDKCYTIEIAPEGGLRGTVDLYCQRNSLDLSRRDFKFDDDAWDAEKMVLRMSLVSRDEFRLLHRMIRTLLAGKEVDLDGPVMSRKLHLELVAQEPQVRYEYLFPSLTAGQ